MARHRLTDAELHDKIRKVSSLRSGRSDMEMHALLRQAGHSVGRRRVMSAAARIKRDNWQWLRNEVKSGILTAARERLDSLHTVHRVIKTDITSGTDAAGKPLTAHGRAQLASALCAISSEIRENECEIEIREQWLREVGYPDDPDWRQAARQEADATDAKEALR